ncbi:MAG: threonine synthase, partial [Actinobacteria bacterium]|nr:threonine synthase [Actinomycetota bacterium]
MRYVSTRGGAPELGFSDTVLAGLAIDGGLYVPQSWPQLPATLPDDYASLAASVIAPYAAPDIDAATLLALSRDAYSSFRHESVAPLVQLEDSHYLMEL